jgi:eukaryotic-like serine/threonine-protein kinase
MSKRARQPAGGTVLPIGQDFEGYRVEKLLGSGGYADVYLVTDAAAERLALKILRPNADSRARQRLVFEGNVLVELHHPNIVELVHIDIDPQGRVYLVMEYLEGLTLRQFLHEHDCLGVEQALDVGAQIVSALAAAHAKGVVHRDLKPENVFLMRLGGKKLHVKVLDWGIAKVEDVHFGTTEMIGTPAYMGPAQIRNDDREHVDARWDLYAVSMMLYEAVHRHPFRNPDGSWPKAGPMMTRQVEEHPPTLRLVQRDCPAPLSDLVMRGLEKDIERGWQSAAELGAAVHKTKLWWRGLVAGKSQLLPSRIEDVTSFDLPSGVQSRDDTAEIGAPADPALATTAPSPEPAVGDHGTVKLVPAEDGSLVAASPRVARSGPRRRPRAPRAASTAPTLGSVPRTEPLDRGSVPADHPARLVPAPPPARAPRRPSYWDAALHFDRWDLVVVAALAVMVFLAGAALTWGSP